VKVPNFLGANWLESKMSHMIHGENRYRELNRENDYRPYLLGEDTSAGYRFGRFSGGHVRASARRAIRGIVRVCKVMHEALQTSRMRRAERELQLGPHSARSQAIRRGIGR
jgi:hypothetical protein